MSTVDVMPVQGQGQGIGRAIEARALSKRFGRELALDDVHLTVDRGSIHALVGANGAGKSTLLRILTGVVWADVGSVHLFGELLPREAAAVRQRVHFVGDGGAVFPSFRVSELCHLYRLLYSRYDPARMQRLLAILELPQAQRIRHLSVGMKMQLRLALALSVHPDLLILDEPTSGLDPVVRRQFYQLVMQEVAKGDMTILIATHQIAELETIVDTLSVMVGGRIVESATTEDLRARFCRFQVVARQGLSSSLRQHPAVLECLPVGDTTMLLVDRAKGDLQSELATHSITGLAEVSLTFEDVVSATLRANGYVRDGLLEA